MPKAKKLPSGNYRCQMYIGKNKDGKRLYKSFTAPTKKEAERLAAEFSMEKEFREQGKDRTFGEAMFDFNESKKNILSPTTYATYKCFEKNSLADLSEIPLKSFDSRFMQKYIDHICETRSPKTIKNRFAYINSVLKFEKIPPIQDITLPKKKQPKLHIVTDDEVKKILKASEGTEIGLAIRLAIFIPARRSEICALTADDFSGNFVTINKALVKDENNNFVLKEPKSYAGYRTVQLPQEIIDSVPKKGQIISYNPDALYLIFKRLLKSLDMDFRFHDLRHYGATFLHAQGVPDKYIMQRGGWSSVATLQNIYTHCLPEKTDEATQSVIAKFNSLTE